jgi:two-component system, NarL family, nitrate/nitrite response regulator NarL
MASEAAESRQIRVLVVDDDVVLAEALRLVLGSEPDIEVVGLAHSGGDGIMLAIRQDPDVVLMDFHLPDMTGASATRGMRAKLPDPRIVMLTMDNQDDTLLAALEAGAAGFLLKSQGVAEVVGLVRRAAAQEPLLPSETLARLLSSLRQRQQQHDGRTELAERLTARELEILQLLATGLPTRAMAERLVVSSTTIRSHVQSILTKLGAHSRLEAVARAQDLGLLRR